MTVPDLITLVLGSIRNQFYADRPRDFLRDQRALTKAVARYGYECNQRAWEFEPDFILREIMAILQDIKVRDNFQYLPVYLHGAVGRSIGQKAEELNKAAKCLQTCTSKIVRGVKGVEAVREPSAVEVLSQVYRDMIRQTREARMQRRYAERSQARKQQELAL